MEVLNHDNSKEVKRAYELLGQIVEARKIADGSPVHQAMIESVRSFLSIDMDAWRKITQLGESVLQGEG